jgi:hypothetical protein
MKYLDFFWHMFGINSFGKFQERRELVCLAF